MLHSVSVKDFMDKDFVSLRPDEDMFHAVQVLVHKKIPGAVVLDKRDKLVGLLSETDCLQIVLDAAYSERPPGKVEDYMTTDIKTVDVDATLVDTANMFMKSAFRQYPVMDHGRLVGIITRRRVLSAVEKFFDRFKV